MSPTLAIERSVDLGALNTLAVSAKARFFARISDAGQLPEAIHFSRTRKLPLMILGCGSNIVLSGDFDGLVLRLDLRGRTFTRDAENAHLTLGAGESWQSAVDFTLAEGVGGLENLTLIPGSVGAAPIQNIGAYGVELARFVASVEGFDTVESEFRNLTRDQCRFGYRDSVFKHVLRDRFIITALHLRLPLNSRPDISYPALADALAGSEPTPALVEQSVRRIRQNKLPDPAAAPNVGSFFKNPVIGAAHFERLRLEWPALPGFPQSGGIKLPAAWLLDTAGWKGRSVGPVSVHRKQPLVLINRGGSGAEVLEMAGRIREDIETRFGVSLEIEPRVY